MVPQTSLDLWDLLVSNAREEICSNFDCLPLKGCSNPRLKHSKLKLKDTFIHSVEPTDLENPPQIDIPNTY
jgi:hypothetical protein